MREYYVAQEHVDYFGSVRTYTFIGMLMALLTYLIGPLSLTAPAWFVILFVVSALCALV